MFRSRQGHQLLRPLLNNTKASSQCVNCLIFIHTVTTALSDCLLNIFTWQLYSHKSYSVISYYSSIQQGVDTDPCLVTIYRLFTDTGQEVSAPNVSKHNRHQLSHQLSVVIDSTTVNTPSHNLCGSCDLASKLNYVIGDELDIDVSIALFRNQTTLRWCRCLCGYSSYAPILI